jgi:hypothetical protein
LRLENRSKNLFQKLHHKAVRRLNLFNKKSRKGFKVKGFRVLGFKEGFESFPNI